MFGGIDKLLPSPHTAHVLLLAVQAHLGVQDPCGEWQQAAHR
jgi:hypothetical protein